MGYTRIVMGVKYIYAGYSKCGTKSMGYVVYDFEETFLYTYDHWEKFFDAKTIKEQKEVLYDMLKDVDVVLDVPYYCFWKELMDVFPDAKCIFWERDEDSWIKSWFKQMDEWQETRRHHGLEIQASTIQRKTRIFHAPLLPPA